MTEHFIGVDRSGELASQSDHVYCVATKFSRRKQQIRKTVCLERDRINEVTHKNIPDWQEKIYAILFFRVINDPRIFQPGYVIHIDKDFQGKTEDKVRRYLRGLFNRINYGRGFWADPPFEFLPENLSKFVKHADKKAKLARKKNIAPDETNPPLDEMLALLEDLRRKGIA